LLYKNKDPKSLSPNFLQRKKRRIKKAREVRQNSKDVLIQTGALTFPCTLEEYPHKEA